MSSLLRSTGIVAGSTLISRIMGFVRDMLMAAFFGASGRTDAFFVAFRIPNLFRRFVAEGALTISFIPVYTEYLVNKGEKEALAVAQKTLTLLVILLVALVGLGEVFSPEIVRLFALGFPEGEILSLAVVLNRIMFPYLFMVSLVAFAMGVLNSHKYFFAPAFAPVLLNIGIIAGILGFSLFFSEPLYGVALGVLVGGVCQVILQVPYLVKTGFRVKVSFDLKHPGIRKIFRMLAPAVFGMMVYQINILVNTILASFLKEGSISYLYYTDRLTELVQGIFIVSIANVILPEMSQMSAVDDFDRLKKLYIDSLKSALFLAIPAAVALMAVGLPVISVIFMHGSFTPTDAEMTYRALFYAAAGIAPVSVLRLTTPTFYSLQDTKTPVKAALVALLLNGSLGYFLMQTSLHHAGLTLALTISSTVQTVILVLVLRRRVGAMGFKRLLAPLAKYLAASVLMLAAVMAIAMQVDWLRASLVMRIGFLAVVVIAGAGVYGIACLVLKVDEAVYVVKRLRR